MKKLLTTLVLALTLLTSYTQDVIYAQATTLKVGIKNTRTGDFDWGNPTYVDNIYVAISSTTVDIGSKVAQHYTIYSESTDVNGYDASYWYAYDKEGQRVRIYLIQNDLGEDFIAVEYNDYAWMYNLIPLQ